jgi:hypothetical protein
VNESSQLAALAVLGAAPTPLLKVSERVFFSSKGLTIAMRNGLLAYFGDATRPHAKWLALAAVFVAPGAAGATDVDVRLPERPAAGFSGSSPPEARAAAESGSAANSGTAAGPAAGLASPGTGGVSTGGPANHQEPATSAPSATSPAPTQATSTPPAETTPSTASEAPPATPAKAPAESPAPGG